MASEAAAVPGPYIIVGDTIIGSIAPVPVGMEITDWYDGYQDDGPDYRFVAETETGTPAGRATAALIVQALNALRSQDKGEG